MNDTTARRIMRRTVMWPGLLSIALWGTAIIITGMIFVQVSEAARAAPGDTIIPGDFMGLPLFDGFRDDGRFGVHPGWGLLVMLIVPAIVGIVASLLALARERSRG